MVGFDSYGEIITFFILFRPWGLWLSLVTGWKKLFPHVTWRVLTATPLLMLPYLGDYIQSIGGISADYKTCA